MNRRRALIVPEQETPFKQVAYWVICSFYMGRPLRLPFLAVTAARAGAFAHRPVMRDFLLPAALILPFVIFGLLFDPLWWLMILICATAYYFFMPGAAADAHDEDEGALTPAEEQRLVSAAYTRLIHQAHLARLIEADRTQTHYQELYDNLAQVRATIDAGAAQVPTDRKGSRGLQ